MRRENQVWQMWSHASMKKPYCTCRYCKHYWGCYAIWTRIIATWQNVGTRNTRVSGVKLLKCVPCRESLVLGYLGAPSDTVCTHTSGVVSLRFMTLPGFSSLVVPRKLDVIQEVTCWRCTFAMTRLMTCPMTRDWNWLGVRPALPPRNYIIQHLSVARAGCC